MHHALDKLAGVRLRADVNDEIASENRAISNIEEAIAEPRFARCSYCTAWSVTDCGLCEQPICEDCGVWSGIDACCPECLGLRP